MVLVLRRSLMGWAAGRTYGRRGWLWTKNKNCCLSVRPGAEEVVFGQDAVLEEDIDIAGQLGQD